MTELEQEVLEKLRAGEYDGFRLDFEPHGRARSSGGRKESYFYIDDGTPVYVTETTRKYFNGEENEKITDYDRTYYTSDEDAINILSKYAYKMYDHPEARQMSKDFYNERDRLALERYEAEVLAGAAQESAMSKAVDSDISEDYEESGAEFYDSSSSDSDFAPTAVIPPLNIDDYADSDEDLENESDWVIGFLIGVASAAFVYFAYKAYPHVKTFFAEKAIPTAKNKIENIKQKREERKSRKIIKADSTSEDTSKLEVFNETDIAEIEENTDKIDRLDVEEEVFVEIQEEETSDKSLKESCDDDILSV